MNAGHPSRRIGPFVVGVLVGLVVGVLLVWLGIAPSPLARGTAPTKAAPPVAEGEGTTPDKANTAGEDSATSTQPPLAELLCLQEKAAAAEGRDAVQRLVEDEFQEAKKQAWLNPDLGPVIQVLRERGYSCTDAEIAASSSKLEQQKAK